MRKAQSGFYPKLGTAGRFGYVSNTMFFQGLVYGADVNFSIPFFQDVAAARAQVDQARAQQRSAESALRKVSTGLELQVRAALARFEELRRKSGRRAP